MTDVSSAAFDSAGCLLLLCTFAVLIGGAFLTYLVLDAGEGGVRGTRGNALLLAIPSILAAVGAFYLLAPVFYRLHKKAKKSGK